MVQNLYFESNYLSNYCWKKTEKKHFTISGRHTYIQTKGSMPRKKIRKKSGLFPNLGGGVSEGKQKTKPQVCQCVFSVGLPLGKGEKNRKKTNKC